MPDLYLDDNVAGLNLQGDLSNRIVQNKTDNAQGSSKSNLQIEQIFTVIEANLSDELVNKTGAIFQFNVNGNQLFSMQFIYYSQTVLFNINFAGDKAGTWYVDLKNGKGSTGKGEPNQPPDATLTMDSQNFFAMFSGKQTYWNKFK